MLKSYFLFFIFYSTLIYGQAQLPIFAFHGVQSGKVEDFKTLKKAGFNISLKIHNNTKDVLKELDAANMAGIRLFIYTDSLMLQPKHVVARFKNHPALYGYYVADEPPVKDFPMLNWRIQNIKDLDEKAKFYVNLYPNYASNESLGASSYDDYLNTFVKTVGIDFISFDYYPIRNNLVDKNWYNNLESIRKVSLESKKDFWGYANSTIFGEYKKPTLAGLRLQQFSNLLYGAKGLQYFTYWTLDKDFRSKNNFDYSIVYENGNPTPTYELVKALNAQIQTLAWIFLTGKVNNVYHDGTVIPLGTLRLLEIPNMFTSFNITKENILVSNLSTPKNEIIIIQNKDIEKEINFKYKAKNGVKIVNSNTSKLESISTKENTTSILPGNILIFILKK